MKVRGADFVLVGLNLISLIVGVAWGVLRLQPETAPASPRPVKPASLRQLQLPEIRSEQLEAAPLFSSTRAAKAEVASSAPAAAPTRTPPVLRGIVSAEGVPGAMLEDQNGTRRKLVFVGQDFDGWTVSDIGTRTVRLSNGAAATDLNLRQSPTNAAAASASASSIQPGPRSK